MVFVLTAQPGRGGRGQQTAMVRAIFKPAGGGDATRSNFCRRTENPKTFEKPLTSTFARSPR
jgi:hypothetical protein